MANITQKLNRLRAAVLGSNDGVVSVSGIIFGVAGANASKSAIITAGLAGLVAGAISMAAGEYTSVSSQRDTEKNEELAGDDLTNPWQAAAASAISFTLGALIPLLAVVFAPKKERILVTVLAVLVALFITGYTSARFSGGPKLRATVRVVVGGIIAMIATYTVGHFFKVS